MKTNRGTTVFFIFRPNCQKLQTFYVYFGILSDYLHHSGLLISVVIEPVAHAHWLTAYRPQASRGVGSCLCQSTTLAKGRVRIKTDFLCEPDLLFKAIAPKVNQMSALTIRLPNECAEPEPLRADWRNRILLRIKRKLLGAPCHTREFPFIQFVVLSSGEFSFVTSNARLT